MLTSLDQPKNHRCKNTRVENAETSVKPYRYIYIYIHVYMLIIHVDLINIHIYHIYIYIYICIDVCIKYVYIKKYNNIYIHTLYITYVTNTVIYM